MGKFLLPLERTKIKEAGNGRQAGGLITKDTKEHKGSGIEILRDTLIANSQQAFASISAIMSILAIPGLFVFLRVLCGYFFCGSFFFFLPGDGVSGCAPVTLARTLSNASLAVISLV